MGSLATLGGEGRVYLTFLYPGGWRVNRLGMHFLVSLKGKKKPPKQPLEAIYTAQFESSQSYP